MTLALWGRAPVVGLAGTLALDRFALFFALLACGVAVLTIGLSIEYVREQLVAGMQDNESIQVDGYTVIKRLVKYTIVDPAQLFKNGFDIAKVTVTTTKVDPTLVKTIGKAEGKMYYSEKPRIFVEQK